MRHPWMPSKAGSSEPAFVLPPGEITWKAVSGILQGCLISM